MTVTAFHLPGNSAIAEGE